MIKKSSFLLAISLCIAYAILSVPFSSAILADDSYQYFKYGQNLLETGIYGEVLGKPDGRREPGYGAFLAVAIATHNKLFSLQAPAGYFLSWVVFWQSFLSAIAIFAFSSHLEDFRLKWILRGIMFVSPTMWGMNSLIFSETIFVSMLLLGAAFLVSWVRKGSYFSLLSACFFWSYACLTKDYFSTFNSLLFIGFCGWSFWAWKSKSAFPPQRFLGVAVCCFIAILSLQAWQKRNEFHFGKDAFADRKAIALAGKVVRVSQIDFAANWKQAVSAAVGTNFCISLYGQEPCFQFHMLGADGHGLMTWGAYQEKFQNKQDAWKHLVKDMFQLYLKSPGKQIIGSLLEVVRIGFIESVPPLTTRFAWLNAIPRLWRFVGSILIMTLAILGAIHVHRIRSRLSPLERGLFMLCGMHILFHFIVMAQVTNLARYGFPILPWVYLFAALGIASIWQKRTGMVPETSGKTA